jgi:hypothetical protein
MPIYDRRCANDHIAYDLYEKIHTDDPPCTVCGSPASRVLLPGRATAVTADDIPGGLEIRHGLCNPDGSPRTYYSKSEIAAEAKRRGLVNIVEHVPERGSDKSKHTTRWI